MAAPGPDRLALPDELLLLALHDERGTRARATELEPALGGAVVLDLALRGRLDVVERKVVVLDASPTGDEVLDRVLRLVRAGTGRSAKHWVVRARKGVRGAVTDRLVARGVLERRERSILWLFPVAVHPVADTRPEAAVRARLDDAVLRGGTPDDRTAALAALVHVTGLQRTVYPGQAHDRRRVTRARLAELAQGRWATDAVRRAIADVHGAVAASATGDGGGGGGD